MRHFVLLASLGRVATPVLGQGAADSAAVHAAALDYVEGVYNVQPERIRRSVDTALVKYGYFHDRNGAEQGAAMNFAQLVRLAETWNREGQRANATSPRIVEVYDVLDRTASVKVTAVWGTDYMLLAKRDGTWKIRLILWQTPPRAAPASASPRG